MLDCNNPPRIMHYLLNATLDTKVVMEKTQENDVILYDFYFDSFLNSFIIANSATNNKIR